MQLQSLYHHTRDKQFPTTMVKDLTEMVHNITSAIPITPSSIKYYNRYMHTKAKSYIILIF